MVQNSLHGGDQRRPCTWKGFKTPKQRLLQLLLSWTSTSLVSNGKDTSVDATDRVLRALSKASDCCLSFKRSRRHDVSPVSSPLCDKDKFLLQIRQWGKRLTSHSLTIQCICFQYLQGARLFSGSCLHKDGIWQLNTHVRTQFKCDRLH